MTLLCQDVEHSFQAGEKAGAVFLHHTAAYDTVWLLSLHMKRLETIPEKHMVEFVMEMLSNHSFQIHTSNGQHSRLRPLKNSVAQGSVLALLLFNIYISDLPSTQSRKYGYEDDLVILLSKPSWKAAEEGRHVTLSTYFKKWYLKLSLGKTISSMFHLNNREMVRKLSIIVDKARLQFLSIPTYLGVKLDRTLIFKQHLESIKAKTTNRVALICHLAGTTWRAATKTLYTYPGLGVLGCRLLCPSLEL